MAGFVERLLDRLERFLWSRPVRDPSTGYPRYHASDCRHGRGVKRVRGLDSGVPVYRCRDCGRIV
ncbi:hypothetical protein E2C00_01170 [Streptomyces sp. WAC05374]|uniref:hypothetical protein n=1 Tax=Streptomyces sp. WAC05374 TaxID=2487420 RepID=UPI000F89560D|nr:hypothetical protein [Streptomyces sp. WAC05374]RST16362.1 hypothetical protein EF905_12495 [Streptomyces sp. WAC05374]TDF50155.1 hypothetical protein E2B92_01145 [Streptomyces sp. WAC05374]TDF57880.1 hypothetical protein E2C02_08935 [Streptomyces sp. WAC05374]TDF60409.1 hypothetical protein E2C00_01170 [Streptomyces sp. WAC05374]